MRFQDQQAVANAPMADGKGILASDETVGTLTKRFEKLKIPSTPESRRDYRSYCSHQLSELYQRRDYAQRDDSPAKFRRDPSPGHSCAAMGHPRNQSGYGEQNRLQASRERP